MAGGWKTELFKLFFTLILYFGCSLAQDEVNVSQGKLRGTILTTRNGRNISAFLGIPYAQPPTGPLRFKNPVPAKSWEGTLMAVTDGNQCPQYSDDKTPIGNEDCLFLNVYTPRINPVVLYPTMVYIHGGNFVTKNGTSSYVGPDYIMDRDVVLVAMNYRLGVLGFLSTGDVQSPGNFGLKDQALALLWVQENIKTFGGDPSRVTIFGQSAGSVSVNLHVLSDLSRGLFQQYIAQSGSSLCFWGFQEISSYKDHAVNLGRYLNCPTNNTRALIDCLREVDVYSIVDSDDIFVGLEKLVSTWVPTNEPDIEGAFITSQPIDRLLANKMKDCPSISGNVGDEGFLISGQLYANSTLYDQIAYNVSGFLVKTITNFLGADDAEHIASRVVEFYFNGTDPQDKNSFIKSVTNVISDVAFLFPAMAQMQVLMQRTENPFYYYEFDYRGTVSYTSDTIGTNENVGVTHSDDLIYLFPKLPASFGYPDLKISDGDEHVIDLMVDLWTSFAYTGIPISNHTNDPNIWKPYDNESTYLRIGHNSEPALILRQRFQEERMHFWIMELMHMIIPLG